VSIPWRTLSPVDGASRCLRDLRARRPRSGSCPSEKARQRASRRGVGPRIPGMNAGPKTAYGGKRPLTGVVAVPVLRPSPLWSAGILPALVMAGGTPALRAWWAGRPREDRLRRQTPVNGRRRCAGVEAKSSLERGHLARIGHGGRDARAPGLVGGTASRRPPTAAKARRRASSHNLLPAILALFSARPRMSPFRPKNMSSQRGRSITLGCRCRGRKRPKSQGPGWFLPPRSRATGRIPPGRQFLPCLGGDRA